MKASEALQVVRALIEDERAWCQGESVDKDGRMCALGALDAALHSLSFPVQRKVYHALVDVAEAEFGTTSVAVVNDIQGHGAVMDMFDIATSIALSDEDACAA